MSDRTETEETGVGIIAEMREGPIPRHQHDRELLHHYADRLEAALRRESGDCAKLRDALEDARNFLLKPCCGSSEAQSIVSRIDCALAAPPRNCDVGSAVEQKKRFVEYCKGHRIKIAGHADVCNPKCPCRKDGDLNLCVLAWAQMPYEERKGDEP